MAKDFSTATKLPDDLVNFDFEESSTDTHLGDIEALENHEALMKRLEPLAQDDYQLGFAIDSGLEGVKGSIEKAAMDRLKEGMRGADMEGFSVEAGSNNSVQFLIDGHVFADQYGLISVNEKYMENGEYPIVPYAGKPEGEDIGFIENNSGYGWSEEPFVDFERIEEGIAANRSFEAEIGGIAGPDEGLKQ